MFESAPNYIFNFMGLGGGGGGGGVAGD